MNVDEAVKRLSELEKECWEMVSCGPIRLTDLQLADPRYAGAIGKLKQYGLAKILKVQNPKGKMIVPVEQPLEEVTESGETPKTYRCGKCNKRHRLTSKIGASHHDYILT